MIGNLPNWIGSQAVAETGQRWMSSARTSLQLSGAGWMSEMAGRSVVNLAFRSNWAGDGNAGYDSGYHGALLLNTTGQNIHAVAGIRGNVYGMVNPLLVICANAGFSQIKLIMEGYKGGTQFTLVNTGYNHPTGKRVYGLNYEGNEAYWWFRGTMDNQRVNCRMSFI